MGCTCRGAWVVVVCAWSVRVEEGVEHPSGARSIISNARLLTCQMGPSLCSRAVLPLATMSASHAHEQRQDRPPMELEVSSNGREGSFAQIPLPSKRQHTREPLAVPKDTLEAWHEATVSSLSLLPVACIEPNATVRTALAASRAHRGQSVLIAEQGYLRGYVDLIDLVSHETQGSLDDLVQDIQHRFVPLSDGTFRVIHAGTRLAEVAVFLESAPLALVSDEAGTHITNVVERGDLMRYAETSGMHAPGGMEQETSMPNRNDEESRRDRSLVDVLRRLDGYAPLIPDEVTDYYLERAGFQCEDVRLYV